MSGTEIQREELLRFRHSFASQFKGIPQREELPRAIHHERDLVVLIREPEHQHVRSC